MIGIYKFTNLKNGKVYIGQSVDIKRRKNQHLYAFNCVSKDEYNTKFYRALNEFGKDSFSFEVLVEVKKESYTPELLDKLEIFYIKEYDSYRNGYNSTPGGSDGACGRQGEENGRALLTKADVEYIRECYNNHVPFREVAKDFVDIKISKRGLQKVWSFENWKDIHPEYYNEENRRWHSHQAKSNSTEVARNNKRAFSKEQVLLFREEYRSGLGFREIKRKYNISQNAGTLRNAILGITYKEIK